LEIEPEHNQTYSIIDSLFDCLNFVIPPQLVICKIEDHVPNGFPSANYNNPIPVPKNPHVYSQANFNEIENAMRNPPAPSVPRNLIEKLSPKPNVEKKCQID
jgi:hypothetical protein